MAEPRLIHESHGFLVYRPRPAALIPVMPSETLPAIAVVIPVFNEEAVLPELIARLTAVFDAHPGCTWSAILVNDGSRDRSVEVVLAAHARDPRIKLIELSRNFGFQAALAAGLAAASSA